MVRSPDVATMLRAAFVCLLLAPIALPAAGADGGSCVPFVADATAAPNGYYLRTSYQLVGTQLVSTTELWREANHVDGLQIQTQRCADGTVYTPDQRVGTVCTGNQGNTILCVVSTGV